MKKNHKWETFEKFRIKLRLQKTKQIQWQKLATLSIKLLNVSYSGAMNSITQLGSVAGYWLGSEVQSLKLIEKAAN